MLFVILVLFRLANAALVQTFFDPDEFWQSLEVAHRIVFGYGFLTWEWEQPLRSHLHPLLFTPPLLLLRGLGIDSPDAVIAIPRIEQAVMSAIGDWLLISLSYRLLGPRTSRWTVSRDNQRLALAVSSLFVWQLASSLTNWFVWYCGIRTYSNTLEALCIVGALTMWPLTTPSLLARGARQDTGFALAALSCTVRPTAVLLWLPLGADCVARAHSAGGWPWAVGVSVRAVRAGATVLLVTTTLDSLMVRRLALVPIHFLQFNLFESGSQFYGTHPWYWYLTTGIPTVLASQLPLFAVGVVSAWRGVQHRGLLLAMLWYVVALSAVGHKEFRFLYPVLPLALVFVGHGCEVVWRTPLRPHLRTIATLVLVPQIFLAGYLGIVHQRGTMDVMAHLRQVPSCIGAEGDCLSGVLFLMPCHSTPFYSHLHRPVPMYQLDCSPLSGGRGEVDSDRFLAHPLNFTQSWFANNTPLQPPTDTGLPELWVKAVATTEQRISHLVMFEDTLPALLPWLQSQGFHVETSLFHSHLPQLQPSGVSVAQSRVHVLSRP